MINDDFNFSFESSDFPVSIEEFAAYMDGNLSEDEMQRISSVIENDETMQDVMDSMEKSELTLSEYAPDDLQLPEEITDIDFFVPEVAGLAHGTIVDFAFGAENEYIESYDENDVKENDDVKEIDINQTNIDNMDENNSVESQASLAARKIFGEYGFGPQGGFDPVIYQGNEGVCAIRSQQIILRDYGIDIPLDTLKQYAIENGWYDPGENGGTPWTAIGNLLESCNVHCTRSVDNTVYDLVNELSQGHRVIVGVDANELWADREGDTLKGAKEWFKDFFTGETPNHALIVAGVDVNPDDPKDVKVVLTDPGQGDLRIEYKLEDFMDAWKDSQCFMVATDSPAPLQYNPETGMEEPSNFAVKEFIDTHSISLSADNVILPGQMAAMCADAHYSDGHLNHIIVDGESVDYNDYAKSVENVHKYKSVIGGMQTFGQDHFDAKEFCSALKGFLGLDSDFKVPADFNPDVPNPEPTPEPSPEPPIVDPIPGPDDPDPEPILDDDDSDDVEDTENLDIDSTNLY